MNTIDIKAPAATVRNFFLNPELGLAGSPTQVYKVNYVVLETTESREIQPTAEGIQGLIAELIQEYIFG